ncbi:uncharacterized protein LOC120208258 [Hibiscus syriacus]|uniref:uncharacterized protein LOC120208258 n=1 Tax=Hibiscus syriacus TaxID=106335 RepID=UPI001922CD27|nr:uncharacterized protein LOC120208258 [Hibiscus syriacus]
MISLSTRKQGTLASDTKNPKQHGKTQCNVDCNAISTESVPHIGNPIVKANKTDDEGISWHDKNKSMKFGSGEARPTTVTLQLVYGSTMHLSGIVENVMIQVDKFIFPIYFINLDFEAYKDVSIILGQPFLVIDRPLIDVENGEITMHLNDELIRLLS